MVTTNKRIGEISDLVLAPALNNISAAAISTVLDQSVLITGPYLVVVPIFTGTITNTSIDVSVGIQDSNGITAWTPPQTLAIRTLPSGAKVCEWGIFSVFRAENVFIALETAITGGGTVQIYWGTAS